MKRFQNKTTHLMGLLILSVLYFGACQNNVDTTFEDSVTPYMELQSIQQASNATFTVNKGDSKGLDSYFAYDISNIESTGLLGEGLSEGWCLEWDKPIGSNNSIYNGIQMFNTFGSETWKPANYLMNIKDELKAEDPKITYREIQVALWSLIETPRFNLNEALANDHIPSRLMEDGKPNFSVNRVNKIVDRVRSESGDFTYSNNSDYLLFAYVGDDHQNGGIVNGCKGFRTQTPGGWGSPEAGNNAGAYRDANFRIAFPEGLVVGGNRTLTLTDESAVEAFLPSGGSPRALDESVIDPGNLTGSDQLGSFAGHVVALTLSITFDQCSACDSFGSNNIPLKDLIFDDGSDFDGMTVEAVLAEANRVLGGGEVDQFTASQLNDALTKVNENFVDGKPADDPDLLKCPIVLL